MSLLAACGPDGSTLADADSGPPADADGGVSPGSDGGAPVLGDLGAPLINPTLTIKSPLPSAVVTLSPSRRVPINFATSYTISAPGKCAGNLDCGHFWVLVDNTACNVTGKAYNNLGTTNPTYADLSKCAVATGSHTITLELRHDDGTKFTTAGGGAVTATVLITAQ